LSFKHLLSVFCHDTPQDVIYFVGVPELSNSLTGLERGFPKIGLNPTGIPFRSNIWPVAKKILIYFLLYF